MGLGFRVRVRSPTQWVMAACSIDGAACSPRLSFCLLSHSACAVSHMRCSAL